ncbi:hypothetical protein B0T19DRAFT_80157 [Cercophora scortea]|uniref:Uncharacterized protein n=1 Tax=Cercophora scortea TaxID=314031 RepID=A0AAE0MMZ3_9PEZI|nr:hypothetical protein B0T19DRAFT_80157 [Cercophora scortea]
MAGSRKQRRPPCHLFGGPSHAEPRWWFQSLDCLLVWLSGCFVFPTRLTKPSDGCSCPVCITRLRHHYCNCHHTSLLTSSGGGISTDAPWASDTLVRASHHIDRLWLAIPHGTIHPSRPAADQRANPTHPGREFSLEGSAKHWLWLDRPPWDAMPVLCPMLTAREIAASRPNWALVGERLHPWSFSSAAIFPSYCPTLAAVEVDWSPVALAGGLLRGYRTKRCQTRASEPLFFSSALSC